MYLLFKQLMEPPPLSIANGFIMSLFHIFHNKCNANIKILVLTYAMYNKFGCNISVGNVHNIEIL